MMTDPNNGRILANRYQLIDLVGKGAMGKIYQAKDMLLGGVIVAVKFLSHALLNPKRRDSFAREATICALLGEKSIHIVRVRDYGVDETEIPYYVMEYLPGKSLKNLLKEESMPLPRFLSLTRQICLGLQCAHNGIPIENTLCPIIHRDIKPSNIVVTQDPSLGELVKILDFGIATIESEAQSKSFVGTPAYCSPEQMEGKELDNRSDIYSLGVIMYEMLTDVKPLMAETNSLEGWYKAHHYQPPRSFESFNQDLKLPTELKDLVLSCLAKVPNSRPKSANVILEILETLESSYGNSRKSKLTTKTPSNLPVVVKQKQSIASSLDEICHLTSWPKDKPQAEIVFPYLLSTREQVLATLWIMLSKTDLANYLFSTRYNQFLFITSPHPMMLWINVLHNQKHGARWLPCYLDLKTPFGQKITRIMGETGTYRMLFFDLEEPQRCANVVPLTIAPAQCQLLKDWANTSKMLESASLSVMSKTLLKHEYEKLKPKILMKLSAIEPNYLSNISG